MFSFSMSSQSSRCVETSRTTLRSTRVCRSFQVIGSDVPLKRIVLSEALIARRILATTEALRSFMNCLMPPQACRGKK
jgi:hypothetical protein